MSLPERRSNVGTQQHARSYIPDQASDDRKVHDGADEHQEQHRPWTLQQAIADAIQAAAFDAGSSDNLAVIVLDIRPQPKARSWPNATAESATSQQADDAGAACTASTEECTSLQGECSEPGANPASSADGASDLSQSSHQDKHAVRAALTPAFEFHTTQVPEGSPDLLRDSSQVPSGSVVGQAGAASSQYRLVQQLAQLPRYADHVHTSWTGLPVLSSMSLWLQPRLSQSSTSYCLTSQHPHDEGVCPDVLWLPDYELAAFTASSSSQVMLSPGTMLQLVPGTDTIPASWGSTGPWDSSLWRSEAVDLEDDTNSPGSTDWLASTATALAEISSGLYMAGSFPAQALPDDVLSELPAGAAFTASLPSFEGLHGTRPDWKQDQKQQWHKYHRSRNFARGSFGEVWHAEKIFVGEQLAILAKTLCMHYSSYCCQGAASPYDRML